MATKIHDGLTMAFLTAGLTLVAMATTALGDGFYNSSGNAVAIGSLGGMLVHLYDASAGSDHRADTTNRDDAPTSISVKIAYGQSKFAKARSGGGTGWGDMPGVWGSHPAGHSGSTPGMRKADTDQDGAQRKLHPQQQVRFRRSSGGLFLLAQFLNVRKVHFF